MRVIIQQQNFKKAVHTVDRVIGRNAGLPVLNNIVLKAEGGRLKILATNLEIGITCVIGAKVDESGSVAIPGRILSDLVNMSVDGNITLSLKGNTLQISSDSYKTNILGSDTKDYPIIPKILSEPLSHISAPLLKSVLSSTIDSVATSEARPELSGLLISFSSDKTAFAATDSFRLTERVIDSNNKNSLSVIVPRNTVSELTRILSDVDGDVEVRVGDNQISFSCDDIEVVSRLIDGNYPDYTKVIPEKVVSKVLVEKSSLEKNIRLAGLFSSSISDIKIDCTDDNIGIMAKNSEKGDMQANTQSILKGDPFDVAVNFNYLLDGLKIIPTEKAVIQFTGQGSPLVLRADNDSVKLTYLIMPLRG